jgi:peptidoglycan/LPS O-acetylase OafA/YrhL
MLVPQAWTISIEIMFYLIAPFFVRKKTWVIALLALLALSIKIILYQNGLNYDPWSYRFFPAEMFFFLLGVLSYKLYDATKNIKISNSILLLSFLFTMSTILVFNILLLQFHQYFYFFGLAFAIPLVFRFTQKSKWDRIIGEYSYPIYITHVFFKGLYFMFFGFSENVSIPVMLASISFAFLYNQFINPKFEDYRQQRVVAN